ncbi:hypothetical protein [Roseomonas sp. BN140053]|uniref:hypothetical protein n=1 Tax=Roseomonas sp. BN140053 TaxID=3391898 RepID=UPI0039EBAE1E
MASTPARFLVLLLLASLAACAGPELRASLGGYADPDYDSTVSSYADAILAGMERARTPRAILRQPATADWPG